MVRPPFLFGTITTEGSDSEGDFVAYGLVVLAAVFQSGAIVCTRALKPVDVFVISSWIGSSVLESCTTIYRVVWYKLSIQWRYGCNIAPVSNVCAKPQWEITAPLPEGQWKLCAPKDTL